jgi:antitoxin component YwqK of YwqJK toxin-antitoxin module
MCKLKDTYEKRGDMEINGISQTFYPNGKVKHQTMFDHYEVLWEKSYDENGNLIEGEHE